MTRCPVRVDPADHVRQALGGRARADRLDAVAGDDDVARGVLGVVGVDGRDRAVLDDDALALPWRVLFAHGRSGDGYDRVL